MWELAIITIAVLYTALYAQHRHYQFLSQSKEAERFKLLNSELEGHLRDLDIYKKRVDALTLRAGFKL